MRILVTGGTGTIGRSVVSGLLERQADVRVLTHNVTSLPTKVEAVSGDLADPDSLGVAFAGADAAFLLIPDSDVVEQMGLNAVNAAKDAGAQRLVYISVVMPGMKPGGPQLSGSKAAVEQAVMDSGIAYTILRPNNFYQNDRDFRELIMNLGVYPQALGDVGVNRVDTRDIADAAVNALTNPEHENQILAMHGPETLTGDLTAQIYSRHAGREVRYIGNDVSKWPKAAIDMLPEWMVTEADIMMPGILATLQELDAERKLVGHDLRRFEDYVAELTEEWKAAQ